MLSQLKAQVESMESDLKARLEAGANVKQGVPIANLKEVFPPNVAWRGISRGLAGQLYGAGKGDPYRETVLHSTLPFAATAVILVIKNKTASRWERICIYAVAGAACSLAILFFLK